MNTYINNTVFSAIIFDMDGTLYPRAIYMYAYYDFAHKALQKIFSMSQEKATETLRTNGINRNPSKEQGSVSSLMSSLGLDVREWNRYRDESFDMSSLLNKNEKLSNTLLLLSKNIKLTLITNNTRYMTAKILTKIGIEKGTFSIIVTSDDGIPLKPETNSFIYIAKMLNIPINEILSIGDRYEVDVKPILSLGGSGVIVDTPNEIIEFSEKFIFPNKKESPT